MRAYVTSIGEVTTDLCVWSLKRNGFDVELIQGGSLLVDKLKTIYEKADDDFIRVDADVVPNKNLFEDFVRNSCTKDHWWVQYQTFGWFAQDLIWGGVQYIKKDAIPYLRDRVDDFHNSERPETALSRIEEFYSPRRFVSNSRVMGLHGYKANDVERVKAVKQRRRQTGYDWELAERLSAL